MPITYNKDQREERIAVLNAHITIAKAKGDKCEVKRLRNLRGLQRHKWGL